MRVGVVGCGYVGKAVALHWKAAGYDVTVTTRSLQRSYELRSVANLVYILDEDWQDFVEKQDVVLLSVAPDSTSNYVETYLRSAEKLVKAASKTSLKQIIYTSSTSVYGDHAGDWVDENSSLKSKNPNAQVLILTENLLLNAESPDRKVCILRLGEIYGPGRAIEDRLRKSQGQEFPGTGESYVNRIHVDEIVSSIDLVLKNQLSGIYNLCEDFHPKRKDYYEQICQKEGFESIKWNPNKESPHAGNKRVSSNKFKSSIACQT